MNRKLIVLAVLFGLVLTVVPADASPFRGALNALKIDEEAIEGVIGLGVYVTTEPYIGVDNDVYPVPIAVFEYKNFFARGNVFGYTFNDDDEVEVSLALRPRLGAGFDASDSSIFAGMSDRDGSIEGGLRAEFEHSDFHLTADFLTDLTNEHEGHEINVSLSRLFFQGLITPRVGFTWYSSGFVDYYYGVRGNEGTSLRPPYEGDSTINFVGGVSLAVPLGEEWAVVADVSYEVLSSEIEDSPIVGDDKILAYVAGVVYRF